MSPDIEIRKIVIDSGRNESKYRVIADLDWCDEHECYEAKILHDIRKRNAVKRR